MTSESTSLISKNEINIDQMFNERPFDRIFNNAPAKILDFLTIFREYDYSEADIAKKTGLSAKTVSNSLETLLNEEIIRLTRKSGKSNMYKLTESQRVKDLVQFIDDTMDIAYNRMNKTS
jgi:DNA-binding transcriptional ArsR family regulator